MRKQIFILTLFNLRANSYIKVCSVSDQKSDCGTRVRQKIYFHLYLIMPSLKYFDWTGFCRAKIWALLDQNPGSTWRLIIAHKHLIYYVRQEAIAARGFGLNGPRFWLNRLSHHFGRAWWSRAEKEVYDAPYCGTPMVSFGFYHRTHQGLKGPPLSCLWYEYKIQHILNLYIYFWSMCVCLFVCLFVCPLWPLTCCVPLTCI